MKLIPGNPPTVELTRRNLSVLLQKLDDPLSHAAIAKDGIYVRAVEGEEFLVKPVEDEEHYSDREPGPMYMPSSGVTV